MKRTIAPVQSTSGGPPDYDLGYGFVLYDDAGKPCASFVYPDEATAKTAANLFTDVLINLKWIRAMK